MKSEKNKSSELKGISASAGIAIGRVYILDRANPCILQHSIADSHIKEEINRFKRALEKSKLQLKEVREKARKDIGAKHLYILDAHIMILEDATLIENTINIIKGQNVNAEWALKESLESFLKKFEGIGDEYLRGRKKDIEQVVYRVLRNMMGYHMESLADLEEPVIIVAHDLTPSDTIQIKRERVLGFATDAGGKTSHTGIMASAFEIPAVVGLKNITEKAKNGDSIIVDGIDGTVIINPTADIFQSFLKKQQKFKYHENELLKTKDLPAITKDGRRVTLLSNIEYSDEVDLAIRYGAEGIGLYRTEYLYLKRDGLPAEEEHFLDYKKVASSITDGYSIIRTLDLGGDKFISEPGDKEANPALGLRGIRLCLKRLDIFKTQLKGILRAGHYGKLKLMYPMISGIDEVREANHILEEVKGELKLKGIPFATDIEVGAMIETPSASIITDLLAEEVDFFSIGTNDLIQYTLAIDRINEQVAYLYQPLHPSVLRIIKGIISSAEKNGIPVSVCGMMGGDPVYTLILLGMGNIESISMDPHSIPRVKKFVRQIKYEDAVRIAGEILSLKSIEKIKEYLNNEIPKIYPEDLDSQISNQVTGREIKSYGVKAQGF
ncbi:MAG: phosphoenolpyruvate--protein phosphotransferase [Nitrospinae bacterium RIFCSPLOWO2_02_FULL_39_110]|nr:MAG: phosphoenolpyruvate--protein phosphotransferase [Nitrospinae bacterium RIFCSPHIGHO2_02_39_11]OGV98204.1 MAG: phosphoenolpyruvate--protein phosphotransferase [Nitrospinae bacterium RIFCSPHIGHO2_12_FULL_39_42]OGV99667.1 MAG: phosphoenolpyruvate--protein phosphotransferase [Nitrospinae bacterium RIFCSPHIGHO2_02_FULL_39_82]OGW01500.1 MAG: phosphoenolpyruvate--protein phosphotransferase [Nitrospinae bacterium RIFCSPLOWO2_02_39_17]OGW03823.1 MAG: phosphoenolpyruvate--protein phosphotransferas